LTAAHGKMVNKCLVYGWNSGYNKKHQQVLEHSFRFNKPDLLTKWIKCDNRSEWKPIKNSIVYILRMILLKNRKKNETKKEMQPVQHLTQKKHQDNLQHWLLPACHERLLAENLSD